MHHVAIMNPRWKIIPKILSGEKSIETRWYATKRAPWDRIAAGDTIFFKDAGKAVTARATVAEVLQVADLDTAKARDLVERYQTWMRLMNTHVEEWAAGKNYAILVFLKDVETVPEPFFINKQGFGMAAAWLCVEDIEAIRVPRT